MQWRFHVEYGFLIGDWIAHNKIVLAALPAFRQGDRVEMLYRKLSSLVLLATCVAGPAAGAGKISFQGLDGSSTRANVRAQFPLVKTENFCLKNQSVQRAGREMHSCIDLHMDKYVINSETYSITFFFTAADKLSSISLEKIINSEGGERMNKQDMYILYSELKGTLSLKYGKPLSRGGESAGCDNVDLDALYDMCTEWQEGPESSYDSLHDTISLIVNTTRTKTNDDMFSGNLSVLYHFIDKSVETSF